MKLLLILDDYLPDSTKVGAKMMHELALVLKNKGHEISVLTPKPLQKAPLSVQKYDGINILFFRSGRIKNVGKIKRAVNETLLSYQAFRSAKKYLKENPHNGIIYYSPSIFFGRLVRKLSKLWNCKTYLILRDIFPQWAVDNNLLKENSLTLARYASICQNNGLVPIVEPEILMDGNHTIIDSYNATVKVLKSVYKELVNHKVDLSCTLLKPNIIRQGIENTSKINYEQVGKLTTKAINEAVPKNVPGIVFLSGGMSSIESTIVLNEINKHKGDIPSRLTFSYGRALQQTVLLSWEGKDENKKNAQQELNKRAKANGLASMGEYINDEKIDETLHEKNYSY